MYFRHLYAIQQPPLEARAESWANYTALFGVILHGNVNMQLPNGWLWDMIDEFVYQFQSFAQYRGKLSMKSAEEVCKFVAFADSHITQVGGIQQQCHQCPMRASSSGRAVVHAFYYNSRPTAPCCSHQVPNSSSAG